MANYFIVENNQQAGPFTLEQLAAKGIAPETNVWTEGMTNWTPASQVPELGELFAPKPEPQPEPQPQYQQEPQPQNFSYEEKQGADSFNQNSMNNEMQPPLKDWKTESIILTAVSVVCCCFCGCLNLAALPFGILGIQSANKVKELSATDYFAAKEASEKAGKNVKIGAIIVVVASILGLIISAILQLTGYANEIMNALQ